MEPDKIPAKQAFPLAAPEKESATAVFYASRGQQLLLVGLWLIAFFWVQWASTLPLTIIMLILSFNLVNHAAVIMGLFLPTVVIPSIVYLSDKKLLIDSHGISFPANMAYTRLGRQFVTWNKISYLLLEKVREEPLDNSVLQIFAGSHCFEIDLKRLTPQNKKALINALNTHALKAVSYCDPGLTVLQEMVEQDRITGTRLTSKPAQIAERTREEVLLADKQLVLKYSTPCQKIALAACFLAFPLWGVIGCLGTLMLLLACMVYPIIITFAAPTKMVLTIVYLLLCPVFFVAGVAATASFFDTAITVGEAGISFPLFMAPFLRFRRDRTWSEIKRFKYSKPEGHGRDPGIIFACMGSGLRAEINLKYLTPVEIEGLLLAINIWGQHIEKDLEIKLLQEKLSNKQLGVGEITYTKMWEDEMNRRYASTSFVPLQVGATLQNGKLKVIKQLAFGGMSAIYLCQIQQTDLVVLKEFVVPDYDSELQNKARQMFEREAMILMKLSHPRLARVQDYFVEAGRTYLLLDYIPGTDLRQIVLQKGKQPEQKVLDWAKQIAEILEYLHTQQPPVIHRDLTPDNILLTADEQIMLIDFGAANEFVGTATGTLVGKESFIAPEQFRGDTEPQSDIYSLGATLYYLLTAEEPQPLSQSFPKSRNPYVSIWMNDFVAECTAFESDQRIPSAVALRKRLSSYRPDLVVQTG
jgi:tRNA A-37 threonylcarbamoyl transferase component Bud32